MVIKMYIIFKIWGCFAR